MSSACAKRFLTTGNTSGHFTHTNRAVQTEPLTSGTRTSLRGRQELFPGEPEEGGREFSLSTSLLETEKLKKRGEVQEKVIPKNAELGNLFPNSFLQT